MIDYKREAKHCVHVINVIQGYLEQIGHLREAGWHGRYLLSVLATDLLNIKYHLLNRHSILSCEKEVMYTHIELQDEIKSVSRSLEKLNGKFDELVKYHERVKELDKKKDKPKAAKLNEFLNEVMSSV